MYHHAINKTDTYTLFGLEIKAHKTLKKKKKLLCKNSKSMTLA